MRLFESSIDRELLEQYWTGTVNSDTARAWRDYELISSDIIILITDHANRDNYLTYRQQLRDWPSTDAFPNTPPELTI